ncbi:hypothetical protein [Sphingomonas pituitosa]|uniref:hypothetical protein n=1 Tax=Sphingomonas pituitosa TaxID=99597 RepID=UPI001FE1E8ED|nr:hypothetical protein [Sphingomonas pituitosa]
MAAPDRPVAPPMPRTGTIIKEEQVDEKIVHSAQRNENRSEQGEFARNGIDNVQSHQHSPPGDASDSDILMFAMERSQGNPNNSGTWQIATQPSMATAFFCQMIAPIRI